MPSPALEKLFAVIDTLIGPDGCPWDKAQTPESLCDYIIEESHELVCAIRSGKAADVREELGDVLFLLLFVSRLYERQEKFGFGDALDVSREKMIRRHPHVFGDRVFSDINGQLEAWERIKRAEHAGEHGARRGVFATLPDTLPPLIKAYRIHSRAARAGFTWKDDEAAARQVEAEWLEWLDAAAGEDAAARGHEFGDLLFSLVELGRRRGIRANEALDLAARRFLRRFARMEALAEERGQDFASLSPDEKEALWDRAKAEESSAD
ncbi:MAG: nucleoside triphosphate pyrophosphohydrolase [Desulfovibrio sp.]|jgi:ATP diphosphatase|nr:nucleoside triphosphate pyrophosphohydrolase [Desulfovibrio sp.]